MSSIKNFFGFKFLRDTKDNKETAPTFSPEVSDDGSFPISAAAGFYGTFIDIEGLTRSETELVRRYREISLYPEVDQGIQEVVDEAICEDAQHQIVKLDLENVQIDDRIKGYINKEFDAVLKLLNFREAASDVFRRWYVDGKLYYHIIIDPSDIRRGIVNLRLVDAIKMKKVTEYETIQSPETGTRLLKRADEYFVYSDSGFGGTSANSQAGQPASQTSQHLKISADTILYCNSGLSDPSTQNVLSYLHGAIRPANQLRMMEDAVVIYRMSRASERRIFKIPVGHLPKGQQETYMMKMIEKYRNKEVYNGATGDTRQDKKFMSMQEDIWLPIYGDGKAADISTLPGGQNLSQIEDVVYFRQKLYQALKVPISRLQDDKNYQLGRTAEVTRDELKFMKFINKLRRRFSGLLLDALKVQCVLRGIMTIEEWEEIVGDVIIEFSKDNNFVELKEMELLSDRLELMGKIDSYIGTYFSRQYVYRNVLGMTAKEADEMVAQIEKERAFNAAEYQPAPTGSAGGGGGFGDLGGGLGGAPGGSEFDLGGEESPLETTPGTEAEAGGEVASPEATAPGGEVTFSPPSR